MKEVCTGFWWRNLREEDQLEDLVIDGRIILKQIFGKWCAGSCTVLIWTRMRTFVGLLLMQFCDRNGF
jgi:hypothetical protein